ncbi:GerAB/ArcD/ProY family transporter [Schinkia azotoformans]|uniref:GerAB/ArcD/ProY family transporter n=1 Tax=Schinkia azotoformans TaxID=1454 RepID=UPI002DBB3530|nr:GerAB/ArcD/ProY family transporter [Schinkia azotoformans]MEC1721301.1 GerAB/ArcD/ProY family transporter [Schinkia azotoformans]MED4351624.1 GerAB/ArcD/ProY family transporter [Schinkia azotoformans]MED4414448.1 GerAB/ArcD/ProY family transporter [Schinkia azotoformans]
MLKPIDKRFQVSPFLVFYIITSVQVGVGVLGFQPFILEAGHDGWVAILLAALMVHGIIWIMYKLIRNGKGDLIDIHQQAFGKWLGNILSIGVMLYFIITAITVLRSYIEVVQVWIFPDLATWSFALPFIMLTYYVVMGGFRTVVGISFFSIILPAYLALTFLFPLKFARWENLGPFFDVGLQSLFSASLKMTLSYLGFSVLLVFHPYVKGGMNTQKWAQLGTLTTTLFYVLIEIVTIIYYSPGQIKIVTWPTLGLWKTAELPFVERFEFIGISTWLLVVLPNITIFLWAASRIGKRVVGFKQKYFLVIILIIVFIGCNYFEKRESISQLSDNVGTIGKYYNFVYIPLLFIIHSISVKVRKSK